jgi:hypothetical protein
MNNFIIFIVGIVVTLITGMGVITSTIFMGYKKPKPKSYVIPESIQNI